MQFSIVLFALFASLASSQSCRCIPGDSCWPLSSDWSTLNETVEGRLIATIPLASSCHAPNYDELACESLKESWSYAHTHILSPSSFVYPIAQNQSCDPFTSSDSECRLGNYPAYAVNASSVDDVIATLHFAQEHNLRLIIKSTGHDLLGKSSGVGSLSLWMHSFRNLSITNSYSGTNTFENYHGPAVRIEPGLLTYEVFEAAQKENLRVIGGTCSTVAVGGGYTSGGGHSILSSKYGLSADNVLEWDVIQASGVQVIATPSQNPDLYWGLSGGGAGVFGIVVGVTVKAFPDGAVSAAGITFNMASSPSDDAFWSAVQALHASMPAWLERNATASYVLAEGLFSIQPVTFPDHTADEAHALIEPFLANLTALNMPYTLNVTTFSSFLDLYAAYYGPLPYGTISSSEVQVSRLIPRSVLTSKNETAALIDTHKWISTLDKSSFWIIGTAMNLPSRPSAAPSNAVLPAWRDAAIHQMIVKPWDWNTTWATNLKMQDTIINDVLPALTKLSPDSGTYLNEGNSGQEDWKQAFYGQNYERLKEVKYRLDPDGLLYAHTGVGSDDWTLDQDGRLCKT